MHYPVESHLMIMIVIEGMMLETFKPYEVHVQISDFVATVIVSIFFSNVAKNNIQVLPSFFSHLPPLSVGC